MSKWQNLPSELLDSIFRADFKRKEPSQVSLTCSSWRPVAQRVLFERLSFLFENEMRALAKALSVYQGHPLNNTSPGKFVKGMNVSLISSRFDKKILDEIFPFIQYIGITNDAPEREVHFKQLFKLIMEGKFPHLNDLPIFATGEKYSQFLLARKEFIQKIDMTRVDVDAIAEIMKSLKYYVRLEEIKMRHKNDEVPVCLEEMVPEHVPQLQKIDISFMTCAEQAFNIPLVNMRNIQSLSNVREVEISNRSLLCGGDNFFLYLMKKFPNLDHLKIAFNPTKNVFYVDNYTTPSLSCTTQFLLYLLELKSCNVHPIITDQFTSDVVENVLKHALVQRSSSVPKVEANLTISFHRVNSKVVSKYSQKRTAYLNVSSKQLCSKKIFNVNVVYKLLSKKICDPYLIELFQKVKHMDIACLTIKAKVPVALDPVFDQLKNVKKLEICGKNNITCHYEETQDLKETALESLVINECRFTKELFPAISQKCRNLKSLTLIDCQYFLSNVNSQSNKMQRIFPIIMKSTRIEELHIELNFQDEWLYENYDTAFIKLETANKRPRFCKVSIDHYRHSFDRRDIEDVDESDYDKYLLYSEEEDCIIYDIQCEAVTRLIVSTNPGFYVEEGEYDEEGNVWEIEREEEERGEDFGRCVLLEKDM